MAARSLRDPWMGLAIPIAIGGASALVTPVAAPYGLALGAAVLAVWAALRVAALKTRLHEAEAALEREVTARRAIERTATDQKQRLKMIIETEPECVKIQAADGTILDMNPAGLAIIDARCREDIVGKAAYGYIAREHRGKYAEMTKRVFQGEPATLEFRLVGLRGTQRWMETHAVPLREPDGTISAMLAVTRDVTDRKHAEENERQHRAALARMLRALSMGEMATSIAHELNQPLTAIVNYSRGAIRRLQASQGSVEEVIDSLAIASAEAERAASIIRNIRNFLSKQPTQRETREVGAIVRGVMSFMQAELRQHGVRSTVTVGEGLPPVEIVPIEIEQVMLNLARNAIEAMAGAADRDRELAIVTRGDGNGGVEVAVSDTGPGLPSSENGDVFEPFFTTKPDGLGMGLAITRSIVEAHGGRIWVERTSGLGTTFVFSLPGARAG
ncbi:MAG: ATP-binding protein [Betaproteobacteria bacterium]|nr:ATP-binding protein [Betaproteobacteria bacterium]